MEDSIKAWRWGSGRVISRATPTTTKAGHTRPRYYTQTDLAEADGLGHLEKEDIANLQLLAPYLHLIEEEEVVVVAAVESVWSGGGGRCVCVEWKKFLLSLGAPMCA